MAFTLFLHLGKCSHGFKALYDYGKKILGPDNYLALRVEDIALDPNPAPTIDKVLRYLNIGQAHFSPKYTSREQFIDAITDKVKGHSKSYGGNKYSPSRKKSLLQGPLKVTNDPASVTFQALEFFGYKIDEWGIEEEAWTAKHG